MTGSRAVLTSVYKACLLTMADALRFRDYGCLTSVRSFFWVYNETKLSLYRFLYQDPTREALQVFLPNPELVTDGTAVSSLIINARGKPDITPEAEEHLRKGVWVNADPVGDRLHCK
jgi:hypothetical protein